MPTYPYTLASALYFQNGHYNAIDDRKFLADFLYPGVYGAPQIYNQVTNPSFETSLAGWTTQGGTNTQAGGAGAGATSGVSSMKTISALSGQGMDIGGISVVNGRRYYVRCDVMIVTGNASLRVCNGAFVQKAIIGRTSTGELALEFVADATASDWRIRLMTNATTAHEIYWDSVFIHEIPTTGITLPYADGDSPGFDWSGTDDLSATQSGGAFSVGFKDTASLAAIVDAGTAYVLGQNVVDQGIYRVRQDTPQTISLNSNPTTFPRIDQVILRVMDDSADDSGYNQTRIEAVPGNPISGASTVNRLGAVDLNSLTENSKSVLPLADVLVPASGASGIEVVDKRIRTGRAGTLMAQASQVANVTVNATDNIAAEFLVATPLIMFDGTLMRFRYHSQACNSSADGNHLFIGLFEFPFGWVPSAGTGPSPIAVIGRNGNGNRLPIDCTFYYAPPKGVFQYRIGAWMSAGSGTVYVPASLEIERA